ncbi:beta-phosphoglucomutase family hydrolase [Proteobacteria bacterium 005FR1]|nr:beta-phosphoglucomutase family hydrolase [Proteobacteria bacterium 005FR1]
MNMQRVASISSFDAVVFDMDGVVTDTARLHAAAWKILFDDFLQRRAGVGQPFVPFDASNDYRRYVDGKPRETGLRSFLASRDIELPEGSPNDPPEADTVAAMAGRKDALFADALAQQGLSTYPASLRFIRELRDAGVKTGLVTSSRHGRMLLKEAALEPLFDAVLDGNDAAKMELAGKPSPDAFLACAAQLGVTAARAVVVEDAVSGVAAGEAGGFAYTVGVDRGANRDALQRQGADIVVEDLAELTPAQLDTLVAQRLESQAWHIRQTGFDPSRERELESIFTVANGYMGVRGAPDTALPNSEADLFVAGIYASKAPSFPYSEKEFLTDERNSDTAELVPFPSPFRLQVQVDGRPFELTEDSWRSYRRELVLREALLLNHVSFPGPDGELTCLDTRRFASLADRHLLGQEIRLCAENYSGRIQVDVASRAEHWAILHPHLLPVDYVLEDGLELQHYRTRDSNFEVCIAARTLSEEGPLQAGRYSVQAEIGRPIILRRFIAVFTSRDCDHPREAAERHLQACDWQHFDNVLAAHRSAWSKRWEHADVHIEGSPASSQALRFHIYHLSCAATEDPKVSVGARALTGRAYEGHVFWDVEIFMLPFYLQSNPQQARSLLEYRHHTLDGARRRAAELGYRGACYAWESTVDGSDVTPRMIRLRTTGKEIPIYTGHQQIHVTADVAFAVWRYWECTGDTQFIAEKGAEILSETARFWCSRVTQEADGFHICNVVGPDEYHHSVDDNAYTNWMAWFNLLQAVSACNELRASKHQAWQALAERIQLGEEELHEWQNVADQLYRPQPREDGVIEQFRGFFELEEYPLPAQERFRAPISRLFEAERINQLQLLKQADVLMLLHLFPTLFPRDVVEANYRYYEAKTDHGSSLSPAVHAAVAARLGLHDESIHYWQQSLWLDLSNVMHNSVLGVHPAAMGGTWQALVFGFLGIEMTEQGPKLAQDCAGRLPKRWQSVAMKMQWRGRTFELEARR